MVNFKLAAFCFLTVICHHPHRYRAQFVDRCEEEKDCSVHVDNVTLLCTVGHSAECRKAKVEASKRVSNSMRPFPYLSAIKVYDRPYHFGTVESLMFQFSVPDADIGNAGGVSGVMAEFYDQQANRSYSKTHPHGPMCRYFDFSASSVKKADIINKGLTIEYKCIGVHIRPSVFTLRLQTLPASLPLVYAISWTQHEDHVMTSDYHDYDSGAMSVWAQQVVAVAEVPGDYQNEMKPSLHAVFQPAKQDVYVTFYDVMLLKQPEGEVVRTNFLQVEASQANPAICASTFFHNVTPGQYKVKIKAQGYSCEIEQPWSCPPLLSSAIKVEEKQERAGVTKRHGIARRQKFSQTRDVEVGGTERFSGEPTSIMVWIAASVFIVVILLISLGAFLVIRRKRRRSKGHRSISIDVTSLAESDPEQIVTEHFSQFLVDAFDVRVELHYPRMPSNMSDLHANPGPPEETLLETTPSTSSDSRRKTHSTTLVVVLSFSHALVSLDHHTLLDISSTAEANKFTNDYLTKLRPALRRILATTTPQDVTSITFALHHGTRGAPSHMTSRYDLDFDESESQWTPSGWDAPSESCASVLNYKSTSLPGPGQEERASLNNRLDSSPTETYTCGVAQFFLPADTHKLYSHLGRRADITDTVCLDSQHSGSLSKALEVYKWMVQNSFHAVGRETDSRSIVSLHDLYGC